MKKRMLFLAVAVAAVCALSGAAQAQNVLYNASFEVSDPLQWVAPDRGLGSCAVSSEQAHTGANSMKMWGGIPNSIKQDGPTALGAGGVLTLDPTKSYQRSVWVYLTAIPNPATGVEIIYSTGLDAGYNVKSFWVTTANQWVQVADPVLLTGYSTLGMFGVRTNANTGNDIRDNYVAYFDDAEFTAVPEPGSVVTILTGSLGMLGFAIRRRRA